MQKVLTKQQERSKRSKNNHQVVSQVAVNCLNSQESRNVTISKSNHALIVMMSDKVVYQFDHDLIPDIVIFFDSWLFKRFSAI